MAEPDLAPAGTVLVSGAGGFVGGNLCRALQVRGWNVNGTVRSGVSALPPGVRTCIVGDIGPDTDWTAALHGVGAVVHLAARVHQLQDRAADPAREYFRTNVSATARLARAAVDAGIRRFVYVSTIKVNGDSTPEGHAFSERDEPQPGDAYAASKFQAETEVKQICAESGMQYVILRPPLVYGPRVEANFRRLIGLARSGLPLPFASIRNQRSMIYVANLADAICLCLHHPDAAGQLLLVSDGEDVSTPELIRRIAAAAGERARLLPCPPQWLHVVARLLGRVSEAERLLQSLAVDSTLIRNRLHWSPPFTLDEGLKRTISGEG